MSAVTRMPLVILVVWVVMVQSECIENPMKDINKMAQKQYLTTDEVLEDMEKVSPDDYEELLRVYGMYRACMDSETKRWTDNVRKDNSGNCPYCRKTIDEKDKIMTRPKLPDVWNSSSCADATYCHESQHGCYYYGLQGSEEDCKTLGAWRDGSDFDSCVGDGDTHLEDLTCQSCRDDERVRNEWCPIMCGYCRPRCAFYCKNYGYMERNSCECKCHPMYTGKQCEVLDCSEEESEYCSYYSKEDCNKIVTSMACPYLCGLCKT